MNGKLPTTEEQAALAESINVLGEFCGMRELSALTQAALKQNFGIKRADVFVLFGGSIPVGGDVLAQAIQAQVAETYWIVGGAGHTTESLRQKMREAFPSLQTDGKPEAVVFAEYLWARYRLRADFLETASTNCGNNITNLLALLREKGVAHRQVILAQDATMQRRMDAVFRKYAPEDVRAINFATYRARVTAEDGVLRFDGPPWGMWEMPQYVTLLLGEIARLTDDANGYGPRGRDYLAHVSIPPTVRNAFESVRAASLGSVRVADPQYQGG